MNLHYYLLAFLKNLVLKLILFYQKTLSFDHGFLKALFPYGYCRFNPSCSDYAYQAISRYGLLSGGFRALKRVLRCHPWNKGGNDPLV